MAKTINLIIFIPKNIYLVNNFLNIYSLISFFLKKNYGDFYIIVIPIYDKPYTYQTLVPISVGRFSHFLREPFGLVFLRV